MKVKFKGKAEIDVLTDNIGQAPYSLVEGTIYNVLGVEIIKGITYYYLAAFENSFYPQPYLYRYFDIVSSNISKYWKIAIEEDVVKLMFEDWIREPDFVSLFVRGPEEDTQRYLKLEVFELYKGLISRENKRD
jgi:hypothetical protein